MIWPILNPGVERSCVSVDPIKPNERGKIEVTYDSNGEYGEKEVTLHVLANTVPEVTEARFRVFVDGF